MTFITFFGTCLQRQLLYLNNFFIFELFFCNQFQMQTLKQDRINLPKITSLNLTEFSRSPIAESIHRYGQQQRKFSLKTEEIPSSIQQYQYLLNKKNFGVQRGGGGHTVIQQRKQKSLSETKKARLQSQTNQRINLIRGITKQIKEIRRQLSQQKEIKAYSLERNIKRIASLGIEEINFRSQFNSMPMMIPVYLPMPFQGQSMPLRYSMGMPRDNRDFYNYKSKTKASFQSRFRRRKVLRKWKKHVYCILFTLFLKKFCIKVRTKRKNEFIKLISTLGKNVGKIKDELMTIVKNAQTGVFSKKNSLVITETDDKRDINQKIELIKNVVNELFTKIRIFFEKNITNRTFGERLYHLCNHGNYSCTQPLLTLQELQMSCISSQFGYISANSNLQIIAITNFIIVKLLLFNNLLAKSRDELQEGQYKITQNKMIVSHVIYCLALQIQADAMKRVPECYDIGNYENEPNVRGLQSMCINNANAQSGELISGLRQNKLWKNALKVQSWTKQKKALLRIIQVVRKNMKSYHSQFIKPFL